MHTYIHTYNYTYVATLTLQRDDQFSECMQVLSIIRENACRFYVTLDSALYHLYFRSLISKHSLICCWEYSMNNMQQLGISLW